jgi:hypothetical protein
MGHFQTTLKQAIFFVSCIHHKLSREEKRQKQNGGNNHEHRDTFRTIGKADAVLQAVGGYSSIGDCGRRYDGANEFRYCGCA